MIRTLRFDDCELDSELRVKGASVHLEPKQREILRYLLLNSHRRVSFDELRHAAWRGSAVSKHIVQSAVSALRKQLDGAVIISTQSGGYRAHAKVDELPQFGNPNHWALYAAHSTGTAAERIAAADAIALAEHERFGA